MSGMFRAAVVAAVLSVGPVQAAVLDYTSFHVLGDSLSDVGNVYRTSHGLYPESPPYWRGRFSNGRVWSERTAAAFRQAGLPTSNEAWGGAKARTDRDGIPDLAQQALRYRQLDNDRRGDRPLVAIWAGGNDILQASRDRTARAGRRAAAAVGDAAAVLAAHGVDDFLIFNMPDLGRIPKYRGDAAGARAATAGVRAFNRQLGAEIGDLRAVGLNVRKVDAYGLFKSLLDNPRDYGLRNVTTPCLDANDNPCSRAQGRTRAFFDSIHPNYRVHSALAQSALDKIGGAASVGTRVASAAPAPVPLPAPLGLLATGLLGLAALAKRRAVSEIAQDGAKG